MKKIFLILGSNGQLGSKLTNYLKLKKKFNVKTVAKKNADYCLNLENFTRIEKIIKTNNYTYVVNCAAYTNLDYCEKNYKKITKINSYLPKKLSQWSIKYNFKFVHISTDHIYISKKNIYNTEKSRIGWCNKYSKSKFLAEKFMKKSSNLLIIRTNFMENKKNKKSFLYWLDQCIKYKKEIKLFKDMYTSTIDLNCFIKILLKLIIKDSNGIFNIGSKNKTSKANFAKIYLKKIKSNPKIKLVNTNEFYYTNTFRGTFLGLDVKKIEKKLNLKMPDVKQVINNLI